MVLWIIYIKVYFISIIYLYIFKKKIYIYIYIYIYIRILLLIITNNLNYNIVKHNYIFLTMDSPIFGSSSKNKLFKANNNNTDPTINIKHTQQVIAVLLI